MPPPESLLAMRQERAKRGTHLVDKELTIEQIKCQLAIYWTVALHMHRSGMKIYIREGYTSSLRCFHAPIYDQSFTQEVPYCFSTGGSWLWVAGVLSVIHHIKGFK